MHESGVLKSLIEALDETSRAYGGRKINAINVEISEFSGFDDEHFREHFEQDTQGTSWQSVRLIIQRVPYGEPVKLVSVTFSEEGA